MTSAVTVRDLTLDPSLETSVLAGAAGLGRVLDWAQTSEMPDPWTWLGEGELLMTMGITFPAHPTEQCRYISKLNAAGVAAVTFGADGMQPPLTPEMLAEADRLSFPILMTGENTPFVVIARLVAAANGNQQSRSILALSRIYQVAGAQEPEQRRAGQWVKELFNIDAAVVDTETGCVVIGNHIASQPHLRAHTLSTIRPATLQISRGADLDSLSLVHLKQVLTVDANAVLQEALTAIANGEAAITAQRRRQDFATRSIAQQSALPNGTYRVLASQDKDHQRLVLGLALSRVQPFSRKMNGATLTMVTTGNLGLAERIYRELGVAAGLSSEHLDLADLTGAASEAVNALDAGLKSGSTWSEFQGERVSLLARSRSEAMEIIRSVLGPLRETKESISVLRDSLFLLLDNDLNWQLTAQQLGIHRQTLAYRIRRAEELTGHRLKVVGDLAELWLARQAWSMMDGGGTAKL
ncbi:PucR family transcriptional regulator [Glutamicibacter sp. NPDC087344]|uniref:PucR family transcriptional regulator n=1 Tax=Glutamicibacter sp. NPDC087344 TaxID=3363994 RepID=UPI003814AB26